jgi:hypothetical protein
MKAASFQVVIFFFHVNPSCNITHQKKKKTPSHVHQTSRFCGDFIKDSLNRNLGLDLHHFLKEK